jgi:multiple sugar transport system permease protein
MGEGIGAGMSASINRGTGTGTGARKRRQARPSRVIGTTLKFTALTLMALVIVSPLVWIFITSLKTKKEMYSFPINYLPRSLNWENYVYIFKFGNFANYTVNSFLLATVAPFFTVLFSVMASYALGKIRFKGSKYVLLFFVMTMLLPGTTGFAPMYILMSKLHMIDKLSTVIILSIGGGIPFCTLLLQGFLAGIPDSLEEAALMDGCGRLKSFISIIIPMMVMGMFTVFIFQFISAWNDVYTSILYINSDKNKTLAVAIYSLVGKYDINWGTVSAGTVISLIPVIFLFSLMKDLFVEGITAGAVKG